MDELDDLIEANATARRERQTTDTALDADLAPVVDAVADPDEDARRRRERDAEVERLRSLGVAFTTDDEDGGHAA